MNRIPGWAVIFLTLCCTSFPAFAQNTANPFELTPRLEAAPPENNDSVASRGTGNPFDLVAPSVASAKKKSAKSKPARPQISEEGRRGRFLFIMVMGILLTLTLLMTVMRSFFRRAYEAFLTDNMMNQVYRDRESVGPWPFLVLYAFFFINGGLFIYFLAKYFNFYLPGGHFLQWAYCTAGLGGLFLIKHLLLNIIGFTFPTEKEVRLYSFLIVVFGIVLGLVLTPINILLAYGPKSLSPILIFGTLGLIVLVYAFRYVRSLFIAERFLLFHRFHFLLYICTVEIAPVMILVKLILNQIQF
ncbi:MAG: DUF4271 domain-containing protein [Saprospiraceae bacterium]|nr:DUF4271 domain-containing protein [Saprospiraceae bacterium]